MQQQLLLLVFIILLLLFKNLDLFLLIISSTTLYITTVSLLPEQQATGSWVTNALKRPGPQLNARQRDARVAQVVVGACGAPVPHAHNGQHGAAVALHAGVDGCAVLGSPPETR
jgi:hypothetical protein